MKKFFLFRQDAVSSISTRTSDTGVGLSLFVIPADKLSFMTATEGEVQMVFDDATLYQESELYKGEAIEKTNVGISVTKGDELRMIDDVMKFMNSEKSGKFMRFDGLSGGFTSDFVDVSKPNNVSPKIKPNPVNTQTGERSFGDATAVSANTIAGINFNYTKPFIDYNHEGLSGFANGAEVTSWANAGTGGSSYNIASNVGDPNCTDPASEDRGISQKGVQFDLGEHFVVPSVSFNNEYTIYMVISSQYTASLYSPYFNTLDGDAAGETLGPGGNFRQDGPATKVELSRNRFSFRHSGKTGAPAVFVSDSQILQESSDNQFNPCHVFIVRRDKSNNLFVQDRRGKVVAEINSSSVDKRDVNDIVYDLASDVNTSKSSSSILEKNQPQSTEGSLLIERLGTTADITAGGHFHKSVLARFGVINQDIGYNESVRLADDLFQFYSK